MLRVAAWQRGSVAAWQRGSVAAAAAAAVAGGVGELASSAPKVHPLSERERTSTPVQPHTTRRVVAGTLPFKATVPPPHVSRGWRSPSPDRDDAIGGWGGEGPGFGSSVANVGKWRREPVGGPDERMPSCVSTVRPSRMPGNGGGILQVGRMNGCRHHDTARCSRASDTRRTTSAGSANTCRFVSRTMRHPFSTNRLSRSMSCWNCSAVIQ
jgi:hypothetical protein